MSSIFIDVMDKHTQHQLIAEIVRLQRRVRDLEDEVILLKEQNSLLHDIVMPDTLQYSHERDTVPSAPNTDSDRPTRPSSPKAIRLDELYAALNTQHDTSHTPQSVNEELPWDFCHICNRTDEHEHE